MPNMGELRYKVNFKLILILLLSWAICACSSFDLIPSDSLIQRLKGRGPVLVSPDNPYLAANLLLEQESKRSKELAGFLEKKGLPSALSVDQDLFSPANLKFFYKENLEQYSLELLQAIWVISGPSSINDSGALTLLETPSASEESTANHTYPPKIAVTESKPEPQEAEEKPAVVAKSKPNHNLIPLFEDNNLGGDGEPLAKNTKKKIIIPAEPIQEGDRTIEEVVQPEKLSPIDTLIGQFASSPAETTPRGDVVHYVTSENETLEKISKWYTKTNLTLSRIARANKLDRTSTLSPGDQIVIPSELVKNKMRLPEEAIDSL